MRNMYVELLGRSTICKCKFYSIKIQKIMINYQKNKNKELILFQFLETLGK